MLTFDTTVSGAQVSTALCDDSEELYYFLVEFKDDLTADTLREAIDGGPGDFPAMMAETFESWAKICREAAK